MGDRIKEREAGPARPQRAQSQQRGKPGASSRAARVYGSQARVLRAPPGVDLEAIAAELEARFPWLARLSNGEQILSLYARRIAWHRAAKGAARERDALPDPRATIVSSEKAARRRARERHERELAVAERALHALPSNTRIDVTELVTEDFLAGTTGMERAGRQAMIAAMRRGHASVGLDLDSGAPQVRVYLDGAWLPLRDGRIYPDAFFETTAPPLLAVQKAYHQGMVERGTAEQIEYVKENAWLLGLHFEEIVAGQRRREVDRLLAEEFESEEERDIAAMRAERAGVAESVRAEVASAMVPLVVVAGMFAVEGASDLFLAVFPVGKAADLVKDIGKAVKKGRKARRLQRELAGVLSHDEAQFVRLAAKLAKKDIRALREIHRHVHRPELLHELMIRACRGELDLVWMQRMLKQGAFDGEFVANFTRYDAYPSWRKLQGLTDNTMRGKGRDSLMSKMQGFLGEEGGARHMRGEMFAGEHMRPGQRISMVRNEKSLDILAHVDDGAGTLVAVLPTEIKHWSAATWNSDAKRQALLDQLAGHNERIERILTGTVDPETTEVKKLLMVTEKGFAGMNRVARRKFIKDAKRMGWTLEIIPADQVEAPDHFIDRLRKGKR